MTSIVKFAHALGGLTFDSLSPEIIEAARRRLFDTLAMCVIGLATEDGKAARRMAVLGTPKGEIGVTDAIRLYVAATRCTEIDDINIAACATVGSVVVPAAVAIARAHGVDDRKLLAAIVAGYDAMIRLGVAFNGAVVLYKGIWPTYVTAPFGVAAVTAKLLGLEDDKTAHALALSLTRSPSLLGERATAHGGAGLSPRWYSLGCAAVDGYAAALAAAAGIAGPLGILPSFGERLDVEIDEAVLLEDIATERRILEVDVKPFPTGRQGLATVEAFMRQTPLARPIEEIERVDVFVPEQYRAMITRTALPKARLESFGVAYQMAIAALEPQRLYDGLRRSLRNDQTVKDFFAKVHIQGDPAMTTEFPRRWGGRVSILWKSGDVTTTEMPDPAKAPEKPWDFDRLAHKFTQLLVTSGIGSARDSIPLLSLCRAAGGNSGAKNAGDLLGLVDSLSQKAK